MITPRWITVTFRQRLIKSVLLITAVLVLAGTVIAAATSIPGDADSDTNVTLLDATCIQRKLAGFSVSNSFSESAADINGDGEVDITDATFIQRWLADMDTPYPIGPQPTVAPTQMPTDEEGWGTVIFKP